MLDVAQIVAIVIALALSSCGHDHAGAAGAGTSDAATLDDRTSDAATSDDHTPDAATSDAGTTDGGRKAGGSKAGTCSNHNADAPTCLIHGSTGTAAGIAAVNKIDLLFVIDNSNSMKEEQARLRGQFAHLITALTTGDADGDGQNDFPPVTDVHLGAVSTDMGLPGVQKVMGCMGLGDDGMLLHAPTTDTAVPGCMASYPQFLSFSSDPTRNTPNAQQTATDFQCIATLGTDGCGFEQQLEAPLKALWPFDDDRLQFLADTANPPASGAGFTVGHGGDLKGTVAGDNGGFLRNDAAEGQSLIAIILVTDEDDGSSKSVAHFIPKQFLDPNDARYNEPLNLRNFFHKDELYPTTRYVEGFKALRPDNPNLVIFAAITGVPPDLVDKSQLDKIDPSSEAERDAFYTNVLADTRMQEVIDPASMMLPGQGNLLSSCSTTDANGTPNGKAYPPRRIVETAQGLGANGLVQSICQDDFGPAVDAIIAVIARQLGGACLPRPLVRASDGKVGCEVVWELPPADAPHGTAPTACGQPGFEFLIKPDASRAQETDHGGAICTVAQLAVKGDPETAMPTETNGVVYKQGWYYDDFSDEVKNSCKAASNKQRISFTEGAKPPTGVTVKLDCMPGEGDMPMCADEATATCGSASVGDPCLPSPVPDTGFDEQQVYVQTASTDCGGGVCIAYHLAGNPLTDCRPTPDAPALCSDPAEVQQRAYCSCRCDAGGTDADTCACPDGFACEPALDRGGPGVRGSYCVRNGT